MKLKIERANMFLNERILDIYPQLKDFKVLEHHQGEESVDGWNDNLKSYYGEYLCIDINSMEELRELIKELNRDIIFNSATYTRGSDFDFEVQIYDDWIE